MIVKVIETVPAESRYFAESQAAYGSGDPSVECGVVNVFDEVCYQQMLGFGAAFTESAAYNYSLLSAEQKQAFLKAYFDRQEGIGYTFGRTHINSCDFSLDVYSYVQEHDGTLDSFDIQRDRRYILPFLKDVLAYCGGDLWLFASPWSPPAYMKDNGSALGGGRVKEEYKRLWARYYAKYIQAYRAEGIPVSAISVQNEPIAIQTWESCYYSPEDERDFLEQHLIPVLDEEGLSDVQIIIWDHNKERVYDRSKTILSRTAVNERVWAVGHHWYSGDHFDGLTLVHEQLHKPTICTEFCGGIEEDPVVLAERYAREMCENINHYTCASCDWNILLDTNGGPYHDRIAKDVVCGDKKLETKSEGCHAPVLYDPQTGWLQYTPIYYYIGHFSKYIQRGAYRVAVTKFSDAIHACAFCNPDGSLVVVLLNPSDESLPIHLRHDQRCTDLESKPHSIQTILLQREE